MFNALNFDGNKAGKEAMQYWKQQKGKVAAIHLKPAKTTIVDENGETHEKVEKDIDGILKAYPNRVNEFKLLINRILKDAEHPFFTSKDYWF